MATAVTYTLAFGGSKDDVVRAAGATADANVIFEVDEDLAQSDIVSMAKLVLGRIIEKYGDSTS